LVCSPTIHRGGVGSNATCCSKEQVVITSEND